MNGPYTLTITGAFDWTGGDLDGSGITSVASAATFSVAGSSTKYLTGSHILNNAGAGTWTGVGEFDGSPGSTFNNSGTFTAQSDTNFANGGAGANVIFNNSGTFTKSGTSGTTSFIGNILNNSGTVDVDSGTLSLNAGTATQIETGIFNVASGSTLDFVSNADGVSEGDVELSAGTQLQGSGLYELDLGTVTVNTNLSVANFTMTNGKLNGPDTFTITGTFAWSGGDLDNPGATTVTSGATLNISSSNSKRLTNDYTLTNQGTALWSGSGQINGDNGSILDNSGIFTAQSDATLSGISFTNSGTFTLEAALTIATQGTSPTRAILIVGPSSTVNVSGTYAQTSNGDFTTEISGDPATGLVGALASTGAAALDGTLTISLVDGYSPAAGTRFTIMTYPSETGDFSTIDRVNAGQGQFISESTNSTNVTVTDAIDAGLAHEQRPRALPATAASTSFTAAWSGHAETGGPGIASYTVYVSDDGGSYTAFQTNTTATSATFTGVNGHTYGFYSIATDAAGNAQSTPTAAQATTEVILTPPPSQPLAARARGRPDGHRYPGRTELPTIRRRPSPGRPPLRAATVQLLSGTAAIGTATADSSGNYTVSVLSPLSPGNYPFTVAASNVNGSSPASNAFTLTIVAAPPTPGAPTLFPADSNGSPGGETTTSTDPHLIGTAIPGATVQLLGPGESILNTAVVGRHGKVRDPGSRPARLCPHTYQVGVIDQYGDVSSPSAAQTITVVNPTPAAATTACSASPVGHRAVLVCGNNEDRQGKKKQRKRQPSCCEFSVCTQRYCGRQRQPLTASRR